MTFSGVRAHVERKWPKKAAGDAKQDKKSSKPYFIKNMQFFYETKWFYTLKVIQLGFRSTLLHALWIVCW